MCYGKSAAFLTAVGVLVAAAGAQTTSTAPSAPYEIRLSVRPGAASGSTGRLLLIELINKSDKDLAIIAGHPLIEFQVRILDEKGNPPPFTDAGKNASTYMMQRIISETLPARTGRYTDTVYLDEWYRLGNRSYEVVVTRGFDVGAQKIEVRSNKITVEPMDAGK
jgi:hypothetical protein